MQGYLAQLASSQKNRCAGEDLQGTACSVFGAEREVRILRGLAGAAKKLYP